MSEQNSPVLSRRSILRAGAVGLLACTLPVPTRAQVQAERPLRVIHLTDMHHMDGRAALRGIETAIEHALAQQPDLILQGGDIMTGTMARTLDDARRFMRDIERVIENLRKHVRVISTPGNHDIWGWTRSRSKATGDEPEYGKRWYTQTLGQGKLYDSIDLGAWTLVTLDSVHPNGEGYRGGLDDEQFEWLKAQLEASDKSKPVLILSHIPILNLAIAVLDSRPGRPDDDRTAISIPRGSMFNDPWRVIDLFSRHGNVKLALSGHVHILERAEFNDTTYICGGAVSGSWWEPARVNADRRNQREPAELVRPVRADPGYGLLELSADATFSYEYVRFPWEFAG